MCLYVDDDGTWTHLDSGEHRARVEHKCSECSRVIDPGETYKYWTGLSEGDFVMSKMCAHCWGTIEMGSSITGCPKQWWWDFVHELDEECGFVGNCLFDHEVRQPDRYRLLRTVIGRRQQWRTKTGDLLPVPSAVGVGS